MMPTSPAARFWSLLLGALIALLFPLVLLAVAHRLWVRRRALVGLRAKMTGQGDPLPRGGAIAHAVSLGEVALLRPLVPLIELHIGGPVVLTTTTETGWQGLEKHFADRPRAFLPLDLPWAVGAFLRRARPSHLILTEAEIWPLLLLWCKATGVRVILLNARASERSHRRFARLLPLARRVFGCIDLAIAQTPLYAARLRHLGVRRVAVAGSLKADMVMLPPPEATTAWCATVGLDDGRPLLLLASTSEGEEEPFIAGVLAPAMERGWRCAICPRHPERGAALTGLLDQHNLPSARTSLGGHAGGREVLIVDEIGKLGHLYARAAGSGIAIVGGSLGSRRGGQNMLEAAAAGCCTVVGWDTKAQPDPMAVLRAADAVVELDADDPCAPVLALLDDAPRRAALGARARTAWAGARGALERTRRILADG